MKKVLVTGASGFIGQYVVQQLLKHNCRVIASSVNKEKAAGLPWFHKVTYVPFNLEDFSLDTDYFNFFEKPDLMIHLAWEGLPNYKSSFHLDVNLPRHLAFLKNLVVNGLTDLTVTGTCFEYGMQEGCLREDMPARPDNPYGQAKDALRRALEEFQKQIPFVLKWVRLFYMYGKGQNLNSLVSQLEKALETKQPVFNMSGGDQIRDFLSVEKMATYIVQISMQQTVNGVINCCSGKPVSVKQFVENYLKRTNRNIEINLGYYPYPDYEPFCFWGDVSKLKTIIG